MKLSLWQNLQSTDKSDISCDVLQNLHTKHPHLNFSQLFTLKQYIHPNPRINLGVSSKLRKSSKGIFYPLPQTGTFAFILFILQLLEFSHFEQ